MIINDPDLEDGMDTKWPVDVVTDQVERYLKSLAPEDRIDLIISFDAEGVSSHPNHIATFKGIEKLICAGRYPDLDFFALESVPLIRKYISYADCEFLTYFLYHHFNYNPFEVLYALSIHHT